MSDHELTKRSNEPETPPGAPPTTEPQSLVPASLPDATSGNLPGWLLVGQAVSGIGEGLLRLSEQVGGHAGQCEGHFGQITQILISRDSRFAVIESLIASAKDEILKKMAEQEAARASQLTEALGILHSFEAARKVLVSRTLWTVGIIVFIFSMLQFIGIEGREILQFFHDHMTK